MPSAAHMPQLLRTTHKEPQPATKSSTEQAIGQRAHGQATLPPAAMKTCPRVDETYALLTLGTRARMVELLSSCLQ